MKLRSKHFLNGQISFPSIPAVVEETLDRVPVREAARSRKSWKSMNCPAPWRVRLCGAGRERTRIRGARAECPSELYEHVVILQNIWWALVLIGIMILIHELGHYWAARFFDVKVETFSFGFGPRLFGFQERRDRFPLFRDASSAAT